MVKAPASHDAIGANAGRHGVQTSCQNRRKTNPIKFFSKRSTATRTRPSRCWDDDGSDRSLLQLDGDLCTNATHGIQTAQITNRDIQGIEERTNLS